MLREVAQQGTIAAAAEQLGYTSSAVSQQLSSIEKTTGIAVLERVGRNVFLTDAGRELVGHATVILEQLERAQAALEAVGSKAIGVVRIGVMETIANSVLPEMLTELIEAHPDLDVRTREMDPTEAIDAVRSGELDMAFTVDMPGEVGSEDGRLARRLVAQDAFHVVVKPGDPLDVGVVELDDVEGRRLIASPPSMACGRSVRDACLDAGFEPNYAHQLEDYPTMLRLVGAGAGVGLVPDLGLREVPDNVVVVDLKDRLTRTIEIVWRQSSSDRPAIQAVLAALDTAVANHGLE